MKRGCLAPFLLRIRIKSKQPSFGCELDCRQ
nr:MAG TPA: hypothetical protein [Bacteriophage sp.]